jgi:hypothetical protein
MVDDGSSLLDPRRDGSACGTLATSPSSRFCKRHEALAQKWGEVRVLSGDDSGNAPKKRRAMMVEVLEPEAITPALVDANGDVSAMEPAGIRPPSLARLASSNLDAPQRALLRAGAFGDDNARSWGLWTDPPQSRPALSSTDAAKSAETAATTTQPGSHSLSEPQFVRLYCSKCWSKGLVTYSESKWMIAHGTRRPQLHGNPLMHPVSKATRAVRYPEPRRAIYRP